MDNTLAIIGDEDAVLGFKALGFKVYAISESADYKSYLEKAINDKATIYLVQDDIYQDSLELINGYRGLPLPVFIPFSKSTKNVLLDMMLKEIRLKATGAF